MNMHDERDLFVPQRANDLRGAAYAVGALIGLAFALTFALGFVTGWAVMS